MYDMSLLQLPWMQPGSKYNLVSNKCSDTTTTTIGVAFVIMQDLAVVLFE